MVNRRTPDHEEYRETTEILFAIHCTVITIIFSFYAGLADPNALSQAVAAFQACQFIGKPECDVSLFILKRIPSM